MESFGADWDRFTARHLGDWHGRALALSPRDGSLLRACSYQLVTDSVALSRTNRSAVHVAASVVPEGAAPQPLLTRYNLDTFHCFADGSFSAEHFLLGLQAFLPPGSPASSSAVELALPLSASERVRCFMLYDGTAELTAVVLLEEARAGMFDSREPLCLSALLGEWRGRSETFRHSDENAGAAVGFGSTTKRFDSPTARRGHSSYSDEDLPNELKNPSSGEDGLLKTQTQVSFGWNPSEGTVRRATVLSDMSGNELGSTVSYGTVHSEQAGLFDLIRFAPDTADEAVSIAMSNSCWLTAPRKRVRGVASSCELGCLVTAGYRRRLARVYGKTSVASETLSAESLHSG